MRFLRKFCSVFAILLVATPAQAEETVSMVWLPVTQALPFFVAIEEGLFEKQGIRVEHTKMQSPTQIIEALIADRAQVSPGGAAAGIVVLAEAQHPSSFKIFGLQGGSKISNLVNDSLIVKADSSISSFADLKGKALATLPGIQWRTVARTILSKHGLNPDSDVRLQELALPLHAQAVTAGTIDAALTVEPIATIAEAAGAVRKAVVNPGAQFVADPFFGGASVITTNFLKARPETARKIVAIMQAATAKVVANFDTYKPLLIKYIGLSEQALPHVTKIYFRTHGDFSVQDIAAYQAFADIFLSAGALRTKADVSKLLLRPNDL